MKNSRLIPAILIIATPFLAYGVTRLITSMLALNPGVVEVTVISMVVWAILLIVPYFLLKESFHQAKQGDSSGKELHVSDMTKDAAVPQIKYPNPR